MVILSTGPVKAKIQTVRRSNGTLNKLAVTHRPKDSSKIRNAIATELRHRKGGLSTAITVSASSCDDAPMLPQRRLKRMEDDLKTTRKMTFDNEEAADSPPTKPRRLPSAPDIGLGLGEFDDMQYQCSSTLSMQRNAAFGEQPLRTTLRATVSSFWDDPAGSSKDNSPVDKPPSYFRRDVSIGALESFSTIAIKGSSPSLEAMAKHQSGDYASSTTTSLLTSNRAWTGDEARNQPHIILHPPQVSPCQETTFRGMHETWSWIQRDFYLPVSCSRCATELTCIKDVDNVLCSNCGTISPVVTSVCRPQGGGVGLGLTFRDLRRCEMEGPLP